MNKTITAKDIFSCTESRLATNTKAYHDKLEGIKFNLEDGELFAFSKNVTDILGGKHYHMIEKIEKDENYNYFLNSVTKSTERKNRVSDIDTESTDPKNRVSDIDTKSTERKNALSTIVTDLSLSSYVDGSGKENKQYKMSLKAFRYFSTRFTGKKGSELTLAFVELFDAMGEYILYSHTRQIEDLREQVSIQSLHTIQRQLITNDRISEFRANQSFGHIRSATLVERGNMDSLVRSIKAPLEKAKRAEGSRLDDVIQAEHQSAKEYIHSINQEKNARISFLYQTIQALKQVSDSDAMRAAIKEMEKEIGTLEAVKIQKRLETIETYNIRKDHYQSVHDINIKNLEEYYAYDIEEKIRVAEERLAKQDELLQAVEDGKVSMDELIKFFSEEFDITKMPFQERPTLQPIPQEDINF